MVIIIGNKCPVMHIRRWDTGEIIATQRLMDMAGYIGHRGDYHQAFFDRVEELGVPIHMGTPVLSYDAEAPSITLETGDIVRCDIVIGADGIKSQTRELVLGFEDKPKSSGYACYRAYTQGDVIREHPTSGLLVSRDMMNIWIGKDLHIVQNTCRDGGDFNWIITHKDNEDIAESWQQPGKVEDAVALVKDWDPTIVNAMKLTTSCLDWQIVYRDPLPTWVSRSGKVVLLGNSVVYERLRYARVLETQKTGKDTRRRWHNALRDLDDGKVIDPESVKMQNEWIYSHYAEDDARERFAATFEQIRSELAANDNAPILPMSLLGDDKFNIPSISDERRREIAEIAQEQLREWEATGQKVYRGRPGRKASQDVFESPARDTLAGVALKA
ncbi:hypothetical protein JCM11641_007201 [Rhodosporidiobolus odoratus]